MKSLLLTTLRSLLDDIQRLQPDVKGLDRDFKTIEARFEDEGYGFLTVALPAFGKALDRAYSSGRFACPMGFKTVPRGSLPRLFSGLTSDVFDAKTGQLKESPDISSIMSLRQVTMLFKKLKLGSDREEILDQNAKAGFFSCDRSIVPLAKSGIFDLYRHLTFWVLKDLDVPKDLECKHGPGAVAEKLTANQKWSAVVNGLSVFDHRISDLGYDLAACSMDTDLSIEVPLQFPQSGNARLVSVPKSSTSRRTITIEPCLNQFVQQGLNTFLRDSILKDGVLSKCLTLTDQSKNQILALTSSRDGKFATIDLSSASDLLSYELVKVTFAKNPRFLSLVDRCRSSSVSSPSGPEQIKKFAGMGNALTFPVQSIVFALICIGAVLWDRGTYRPRRRQIEHAALSVRVYGDDIIVPTKHYDTVVEWLNFFGLLVNSEKSFSRGNFRESCGVDAYNGVDITPLYLRYEPCVTSMSAEALENVVSVANQAWLRCYYEFSDALKKIVEDSVGHRLPLVSFDAPCLGWHTRLNVHDSSRWNRKLQRFEVKSLCGYSSTRSDPIDGYAALMKFYHTPLLGRPVGHLSKTERRFTLKHRWRWVQAG